MSEITILYNDGVTYGLHETIKAAFPLFDGLAYDQRELRLIFFGELSPAELLQVHAIVEAYDPAIITATRDGDVITATVTKPRNLDSATEVTLLIDGVEAVVPLDVAQTITDIDGGTMTLNVAVYPCQEVTL